MLNVFCLILKIHGPCDFDIVKDDLGIPILLDAGSRFSVSLDALQFQATTLFHNL